jgi:hypothetical protein
MMAASWPCSSIPSLAASPDRDAVGGHFLDLDALAAARGGTINA